MDAEEELRQALKPYCGFLVGLAYVATRKDYYDDKPVKQQGQTYFNSGVILEVADTWYWLTAGHVLQDIATLEHPDWNIGGFCFADSYGVGSKTKEPTPFDFKGAWKHYEYHSGLDYGIVEIDSFTRISLAANNVLAM